MNLADIFCYIKKQYNFSHNLCLHQSSLTESKNKHTKEQRMLKIQYYYSSVIKLLNFNKLGVTLSLCIWYTSVQIGVVKQCRIWLQLTLLEPPGFGDFCKKNSSFWLPYQRPSSSNHCARELFSVSNGSASLVDCNRKKIFCLGGAVFL